LCVYSFPLKNPRIAMIHKDTTRAKALALALEGQGLDGEKMEERWNRTQVDLKRGVLS